ncbi:MAG: 5-formyltetrahydrofolate cyclo-ligase [Bacteroidota bacterium]|nr:5-formyltetrahydrofolate cyclo-ligase [Candidatus Kapabacteria bacterium]MDW8220975.1 5-formyltetrahydrofolate cyclo-ligase [Bacteroidota bacterium]
MWTKADARDVLLRRRNALTAREREYKTLQIVELLCAQEWWHRARTIHTYLSFGTEVSTAQLRECAWKAGKRILAPIVQRTSKSLLHAEITPQTVLLPDSYGIPTPQTPDNVEPHQIMDAHDCIIVPLVGFDAQLYRIGYGKGYYDRFLQHVSTKNAAKPRFVGLAYAVQYSAELLPVEEHDIRLDSIITEWGVVDVESGELLAQMQARLEGIQR